MSYRSRLAAGSCGLTLLAWGLAAPVTAAPVVRSAQIHVVLTSPTSCDVDASYAIQIDKPGTIAFTLQTFDGTRVELSSVNGAAAAASDLQQAGKTTVFMARSNAGNETTTLRYHVTQRDEWAYRCPIWLPAVPTDRRPGGVNLRVEWPAGASLAGSTLPPLQPVGAGGASSLAHIPSFVRVPYLAAGETRSTMAGWDVSRAVDTATIVVLVSATLVWIALRERRRRRAVAVARGS